MVKILPLSKNKLDEAISLVEKIFPYKEDQKIASINLVENLSKKNYWKCYWITNATVIKLLN